MATITRQVDEQGRCYGFAPADSDVEVGEFGDGLEGESVELDDGRTGTVTEVLTRIHTQQWASNYVHVEIELDGEAD